MTIVSQVRQLEFVLKRAPYIILFNFIIIIPSFSVTGKIAREALLLSTLDHPNIVMTVAVYHNKLFYQLVMEQSGPTFDLFTFVDENPAMNEAIASHIFCQVVEGVAYLHSKKVLHRDIKEENIVLDFNLHARLIDFGSACYMTEDHEFDTFCGTMDYCAPEVLKGNKYKVGVVMFVVFVIYLFIFESVFSPRVRR